MKRNIVPLLGVAFVVATICTGVLYGLLAGRLRSAAAAPAQTVVVAAHKLNGGIVLRPEDLKLAPWPAALPAGAYTSIEKARDLVLVEPLQEGEPLTATRIASTQSAGAGAYAIPPGMRAVSVRVVDSPGITPLLRPGYHVDLQFPATQASGGVDVRTVLQNIEVLAINPQLDAAAQANPMARAGLVVLALLVKPEQADLLSRADIGNRLRLVLRHPSDTSAAKISSLVSGELTRHASSSPPASDNGVMTPIDFTVQVVSAPSGHDAKEAIRVIPAASVSEDFVARPGSTVIRTSRWQAPLGRPLIIPVSTSPACAARLRVRAEAGSRGAARIWLQPEVQTSHLTIQRAAARATVAAGESLLIGNWEELPEGNRLLASLSPQAPANGRQLLVLLTPQFPVRALPPSASAQ